MQGYEGVSGREGGGAGLRRGEWWGLHWQGGRFCTAMSGGPSRRVLPHAPFVPTGG